MLPHFTREVRAKAARADRRSDRSVPVGLQNYEPPHDFAPAHGWHLRELGVNLDIHG
jgi:hypothetical protein